MLKHNYNYYILEIKPCGLGPRIRDVEAFWYKTEIKIIYFLPLFDCVWSYMVYPDPKFLIFKTKKCPCFFLRLEAFFSILCYRARHLQQIHWNENFCRMYVLAVIASVARLNICQILMRSNKVRSFLKQCLHNLHFMKAKPFHQTLPS